MEFNSRSETERGTLGKGGDSVSVVLRVRIPPFCGYFQCDIATVIIKSNLEYC